jgi:GT2 family glycosyltransferase
MLQTIAIYVFRKLIPNGNHLANLVNMNSHHLVQPIPNHDKSRTATIIIPTKDNYVLLRDCINSIVRNTRNVSYEILIVDNGSEDPQTLELLSELADSGIEIYKYPGVFNFSEMCNRAASKSEAEFLCFLNDDTEVVSDSWLESMIAHASKPNVGVVGAVLTYPNGTIQHMGIALGHNGIANHPNRGSIPGDVLPGCCFKVTAVTFACALVSRKIFNELNGLDTNLPVAFNDVDFCLRSQQRNYWNIICLHAKLTHKESQSRAKTLSFRGFRRGIIDVFALLRKYEDLPTDAFFSRRVLASKSRKKRHSIRSKRHNEPKSKS